jgi:hypothetical protein
MCSSAGVELGIQVALHDSASTSLIRLNKVPCHCFLSDQANAIWTAIEAFCHTFESKTNNDWEEISRGVEFVRF